MIHVTQIVNSVYASMTYMLSKEGNTDIWIVDCGDVPPLVDMLLSLGGNSFIVKGVLLTHAHYDHIYGLPQLTDLYPDVKVYTNAYGREALANERINMSRYHEDPINYDSNNIMICKDGDEMELFNDVRLKVHYTPGHNDSCLTYEVGPCLFTGDAYIPGIKVVTNLPGGNKQLAMTSLERIKRLAEGKLIYPGHDNL